MQGRASRTCRCESSSEEHFWKDELGILPSFSHRDRASDSFLERRLLVLGCIFWLASDQGESFLHFLVSGHKITP